MVTSVVSLAEAGLMKPLGGFSHLCAHVCVTAWAHWANLYLRGFITDNFMCDYLIILKCTNNPDLRNDYFYILAVLQFKKKKKKRVLPLRDEMLREEHYMFQNNNFKSFNTFKSGFSNNIFHSKKTDLTNLKYNPLHLLIKREQMKGPRVLTAPD